MRISICRMAAMLFFSAGCVPIGAFAAGPKLDVMPRTALFDQVVHIGVRGLKPREPAEITLERTSSQPEWRSTVVCVADMHGTVDLQTCIPQNGGSYAGADAMGLFWSLQPPPGAQMPRYGTRLSSDYTVGLRIGGRTVASSQLTRTARSATVRTLDLPANMVGAAFAPGTPGKHPALLLVGGSEGGHTMDVEAALFASHGYDTLSLAYFGDAGLPNQLVNVPLETIENGLKWLAAQPGVDSRRIGMMGVSKGGELTLLAASMFPQIKAAVGIVPSSVVWQGIDRVNPGTQSSSWTYRGKALTFVPYDQKAGKELDAQFASGQPVSLQPMYAASLANAPAIGASIPVSKINGPVLVVSGDSDKMWPSTSMSDRVMTALAAAHRRYPDAHLHYKDAGHTAFFPFAPVHGVTSILWPGGGMAFGGTEAGDAKAAEDAWPKIERFLAAALHNPGGAK